MRRLNGDNIARGVNDRLDLVRVRQVFPSLNPLWQGAMSIWRKSLTTCLFERIGPSPQFTATQLGKQHVSVKQLHAPTLDLTARIETKLKHWNHGTTVRNPADDKRDVCVSNVSGINVSSRDARF